MSAGDDVPPLTRAATIAGQSARTETTEVTAAPEFTNRAFVLAVPRDSPSVTASSSAATKRADAGKAWDVTEAPGGINAPGGGDKKVTGGGEGGADVGGEGDDEGHVPALLCQLYGARSSLSSALGQDVLIGRERGETSGL